MGICGNKDPDASVIQIGMTSLHVTTYLIGDIGGTNARFILKKASNSNKENEILREANLETKKYPTLIDCLKSFLSEFNNSALYPAIFCMGIAGPTKEATIKITNADWPEFNVEEVREKMKFQHIRILNDFEANGYGVLSMEKHHYIQINKVPVIEGAPKALIGAGTGLGECILTKALNSRYYDIYPCEGGHTDFAPRTDFEFGYMSYVKDNLNIDRVSVERCVAGPAIPLLYQYISQIMEIDNHNSALSNKDIIDAGKAKKDPVCERVVEEFISMYGAEAGNLALKILPFGGLYLLSGVTQTLKDKITNEKTFMNNFLRKGRMQSLLEKVPIFIVNENIGLVGAEEAALRYIKK